MGLHVYSPVLLHALHEDDHDRRLEFCELFQRMHVDDPNFIAKVIWSDEAVFKLNGTINRHNCIFYDASNPHVVYERAVNLPGVCVWAGVWSGGIIGPYFFPGTVTGESYLAMLSIFYGLLCSTWRKMVCIFSKMELSPIIRLLCESGWTTTFPTCGLVAEAPSIGLHGLRT